MDWWQGYSLSFRRSVPMLKSTSQLASEARATDTIHMDTTIRTAIPTTDHTGIMVTVAPTIGTAATATTVTTEITTTIGGKELT